MMISKTSADRLARLEPALPPPPMGDRALRRAALAELAAAAEFYHHPNVDLELLADEADRYGTVAHVGARVALLLCDVRDRLERERDLG